MELPRYVNDALQALPKDEREPDQLPAKSASRGASF